MEIIDKDSPVDAVKEIAREAVAKYLQNCGCVEMSPHYALCDMDGTLYDSMPWHSRAWQEMMLQVTGHTIPRNRFLEMEGRTGANTIDILFQEYLGRHATPQEQRDYYEIKSKRFRELQACEGTHVMPGAQSLIKYMCNRGIVPVLVTGSGQSSLLDRLNADFDNAFSADLQVNAHSGAKHGKPAPDPYLLAMEKSGAEPCQCFVLENAPLGVQSGVAAGVFTIAVRTGDLPAQLLIDSGANLVFDTMPVCSTNFSIVLNAMCTVKAI